MSTLLILDANQRSALAAIRSLGRLKETIVYAADSNTETIGGSSRFCHKYLVYPSLVDQPQAFLEWLKTTLSEENIDLVFPMTEKSSQLLLMQNQLTNTAFDRIGIPFADYKTVMSLAHKGQLIKMAESNGIRCPQSYYYSSSSEVDTNMVDSFPVVIKPCLSQIWQDGHWVETTVQIAHNRQQLEAFLSSSPWLQANDFMLQEFIKGFGAGLFALYNRGKPVCFFSHRRIREKPPQGGVSVLSESIALDPKLLEISKKLLGAADWHGVAMVEFRLTSDGTPYLMEVNTRFWGSLQLAIDAGVDFPKMLYQIAANKQIDIANRYKEGVRLRWLLGDLDSLYLVLKSSSFSLSDKLHRIRKFLTPHVFTTQHEVNRWGDLKPALTELKQYINHLRK